MSERLAVLIMLFLTVTGCAAPTPHMIPTPVAYKHPSVDLLPALRPESRTTEVPVFYATTRAPVAAGDPGHYRDAAGDGVRLGVASVRLGEPGWTWDQLVASDATDTLKNPRPGQVESVREFGLLGAEGESAAERAFIAQIDQRLARGNNQELVFYVHGYKVFFDEVTVMMGSWSHYLGHGAIATFQWPTGQNFWNYLTDCPRAERYVPDIERTIALLAKSRATNINIIAYSCGSPLLGEALARLRARHPTENREQLARRYRISNVIFAASDVDLKTFASELAPPVMDLARQTIIYVSRNDAALGFSSLLAATSRLGRPDIKELTPDEIERLAGDPRFQAIDVSDVRGAHEMGGMRGHGYWYANDWIATDVAVALRFPTEPSKRCLVPTGRRNVWKFPEGYPDCIAERLIAAQPQVRRATPR